MFFIFPTYHGVSKVMYETYHAQMAFSKDLANCLVSPTHRSSWFEIR